MSRCLAELCALLIEDTYGAFYSHIFFVLTLHGRLSAPQIAQKCHLTLRHIRYGLSVLIQAHLVYYNLAADGRASYQANAKSAYNLARSGRVIDLVQGRLGEKAAVVVSHLMLLGHARVSYLRRQVNLRTCESQANLAPYRGHENTKEGGNAVRPTPIDDSDDGQVGMTNFDEILRMLVDDGVVMGVREAHFQTYADNLHDAEHHIRASESVSETKGKKAQTEFEANVRDEVRHRNKADIKTGDWINGSSKTLKRSADDTEIALGTKRRKTDGVGAASIGSTVRQNQSEDLVLQVNHDKIIVLLRNKILENLAGRMSGKSAARIYTNLLKQLEDSPYQYEDKFEPPPEREREALDINPRSVDFNKLILAVNAEDEVSSTKDNTMLNGYHGHAHSNGHVNGGSFGGDTITGAAIEEALNILAEGPYAFVNRDPDSLKWTVDYHQLAIHLRNQEVLRVIRARFGGTALRIIHILLDKGKLDERNMQEIGLLSAKDLRQTLAQLKSAGFLELQEVPREPQRQPSRTMYLWFYDPDRVRRMFLEDVYKSMARCLQRLKVERRKVMATVEKAERSDVKGREEEFLGKAELEFLAGWRKKEEWLLGEVGRLDDLVAILRDF